MSAVTPESLREALSAADACVQCGACMHACPVYRVGRREELGGRGKLRLLGGLKDGRLVPGREAAEILSRCVMCGRCSAACPNQVQVAEALTAGRAILAQENQSPSLGQRILQGALRRPRNLNVLGKAARLAQPLLRHGVPLSSGLHLRLAGIKGLEKLPPLAARPFLADAPREIAGPQGAPRLGLFVGCVANYLRPELARQAVAILSKRFTVVIPPGQGCCGLPGLAAGLVQDAQELFLGHADIFSRAKVDLIVTTCGSCAFALGKELPRLLGAEAALPLGAPVKEITQVLAEEPGLVAGLGAGAGPAVLHDPCNLKVGLGVFEEPRVMLKAAGVELAEMEEADACCGGGGLLPLNDPKLSQAVFAPRARAFAQSGAQAMASACSGCYLQWRRGLPPEVSVLHPIELLGRAR